MSKPLLLEQIKNTTDTQGRAGIDDDHVADLRAAWEAKADVPPLLVYFDGTDYWLADGFHRLAAARLAKRTSVPCDIQKGSKRDAWLAALAANKSHGLRRSPSDKKRLITLALNDDELVKWSDNRIAEHIGVTQPYVSEIRKQLITVISSPAAKTADEPKVGKDGKARKSPTKSTKKPSPSVTGTGSQIPPASPPSLPTEGTVSQADTGSKGDGDAGGECKPGEHVWTEKDGDGEYCKRCKVGKDIVIPPVVPIDPNGFDPANIEAHAESFAANFAARVKAHNLAIERFARKVSEAFEAEQPLGIWFDDSRAGMARDSINAAVATIRQAKCHDKPCPKCDGEGKNTGKPCKQCRGAGFMPKVSYEMAGGK